MFHRPVTWCQRHVSAYEFAEWVEAFREEPWGLADVMIRGLNKPKPKKTPAQMWNVIAQAAGAARGAKGNQWQTAH